MIRKSASYEWVSQDEVPTFNSCRQVIKENDKSRKFTNCKK